MTLDKTAQQKTQTKGKGAGRAERWPTVDGLEACVWHDLSGDFSAVGAQNTHVFKPGEDFHELGTLPGERAHQLQWNSFARGQLVGVCLAVRLPAAPHVSSWCLGGGGQRGSEVIVGVRERVRDSE